MDEPAIRIRDAGATLTGARRALQTQLGVGRLRVVGQHDGVGELAVVVQDSLVVVREQVITFRREIELVLCRESKNK